MNHKVLLFSIVFYYLLGEISCQSISWNQNWANGCDFIPNDIAGVRLPSEKCGPACDNNGGCTHFTWSTYNGGTCWLKKGPASKADAFPINDKSVICGVSSFRYWRDTSPNLANWLSGVPNDAMLWDVSVPGTHDSCTSYDTNGWDWIIRGYWKTQDWRLPEQFSNGIRFVDIRCRVSGNAFAIHHGSIYLMVNFDDVLQASFSFLSAHPTEYILMSVKEEGDHVDSFSSIFNSYIDRYGKGKFYLDSKIPSVGMVRGKIVILKRFGGPGIDFNFGDNIQGQQLGSLYIQDFYNPPSYASKKNAVQNTLNLASQVQNNNIWFFNFLNIGNYVGVGTIGDTSEVMNKAFIDSINSLARPRYGTIIMDYPYPYIINTIIRSNFLLNGANPPWWCNAAVTKCKGGQDSCCIGFWNTIADGCYSACAQCNRC